MGINGPELTAIKARIRLRGVVCRAAWPNSDARSRSVQPQQTGDPMRSDIDIKRDVEAELQANPDIDSTDIAVAVKSGVVTLSGYVRSYMQRWEAEKTAKRVT